MRTKLLLALAGTIGLSALAGPPASPTFDRFKALAGEWIAAEDLDTIKKGDLVARYRLTGGGSAVVEELFPGKPHEMTTVYHLDGEDVVLTHYCMGGNQPRMRARQTKDATVAFAYDGGTNIDPKKTRHMHQATFEFVSADEFRTEWVQHADGKPGGTVRVHLVRKAS
jgi:hypothetical protein